MHDEPPPTSIAAEARAISGSHDEKAMTEVSPQATDEDPGFVNGLERWNQPRVNAFRFIATLLSLFIMGMNDACIGVG